MLRRLPQHVSLILLFAPLTLSRGLAEDFTATTVDERQSHFFEQRVRPLLAAKCFACHGETKQESDLRLDNRGSILRGGSSGEPAVIPGESAGSLLVQYATRQVEGMEMPPDEPLTKTEMSVLQQWVDQGLFWPREVEPTPQSADERLARDRTEHWAFQPIRPVTVAKVTDPVWREWPRTGLDRLVLGKLLSNGLTPSAPADRRTLIRRVYFDLIGLPPTIRDVDRFVFDDRSDAYERLVDRLLASPQYGERWGRHWLDVARYADTRGYAFNRDRNYPFAYTYRDYVIHALNDDLPLDQFIVQQLAADQLDLGEDNRALAALGFLTVGRKFNNRHDDIDDQIDVVMRGLQGLTVACARCHDHKYDAIPTEDYYSLYGVFASSHEPSQLPLIGDSATLPTALEYQQRLDAVQAKLSAFDNRIHADLTDHARTRISDYLSTAFEVNPAVNESAAELGLRPALLKGWKRLLQKKAAADDPTLMPWFALRETDDETFPRKVQEICELLQGDEATFVNPFIREAFLESPPQDRRELALLYDRVLTASFAVWQEAGGNAAAQRELPTEQRQLLWYFSDPGSPMVIKQGDIEKYLTEDEQQARDALKQGVEQVQSVAPTSLRRAMVLRDKSHPTDAAVLIRGDPSRPGRQVPRRAPRLVSATSDEHFQHGSGRLELARMIANPENPLTARVLVNRVWMHHFGRPLVATPSDFGVRATEPVQRQLLDHLAARLLQSQWSLKRLHREVLLSATYRQASGDRNACYAVDPENRLLWRMNRRRLEFESLRDALLATSGDLDTQIGGKPVRLFEQPEHGRRRSIYGYVDRQDLPNLLRVFDFASPDQSAAKRTTTSVPQQSLFLMNSPFLVRLARRIAAQHADADWANDDELIAEIYLDVLARRPLPRERLVVRSLLEAPSGDNSKLTPVEQLVQLLLMTNEFAFVD